jgi:hypothetical protein
MIDSEKLPPEIRFKIQKDIESNGEWATYWNLYYAPLWRMVDDLKDEATDTAWLAVVIHMIQFFTTKDPSLVHYRVTRDYLDKQGISDSRAVDMLARSVVTACEELRNRFASSAEIPEEFFNCVVVKITENDPPNNHTECAIWRSPI